MTARGPLKAETENEAWRVVREAVNARASKKRGRKTCSPWLLRDVLIAYGQAMDKCAELSSELYKLQLKLTHD